MRLASSIRSAVITVIVLGTVAPTATIDDPHASRVSTAAEHRFGHRTDQRADQGGVAVPCHDNQALVDAITNANAVGRGVITLARRCTYTLTAVFPGDYGNNALPKITGRIVIEGNGAVLARALDAPLMRILQVAGSGDLTIRDTTLANGSLDPTFSFGGNAYVSSGSLTLLGCRVVNGFARWGGGLLNDGPMTVTDSVVTGNSAYFQGGGIWDRAVLTLTSSRVTRNTGRLGYGGVVIGGSAPGPTATATISSTTVSDNNGNGIGNDTIGILYLIDSVVTRNTGIGNEFGAGLHNQGVATVTDSVIANNHSPSSGGGVYNTGSELVLERTKVAHNTARTDGGGIWNARGTTRVSRSRIVGNTARDGRGGGLLNGSPDNAATTRLNHTVVKRNSAGRSGGGVFNERGEVVLRSSKVIANRPDNFAPHRRATGPVPRPCAGCR